MANIPRLRAVLMHNATRSVWIQPLAVVYWPYITNPRGIHFIYLFIYRGQCTLININITITQYPCKCAGVSQKLICSRCARAAKDNYTVTIHILTKTIQNTNTLHPIIYKKVQINPRTTAKDLVKILEETGTKVTTVPCESIRPP